MTLAFGPPFPGGPGSAPVLFVVGLVLVVGGLALALRPRRTGRPRGGFGAATGQVVDHREGKRPTVVEFVAAQGSAPTRFKTGERHPVGTTLPVVYSLADPRNARLDRPESSEFAVRAMGLRAGVLAGLLLVLIALILG